MYLFMFKSVAFNEHHCSVNVRTTATAAELRAIRQRGAAALMKPQGVEAMNATLRTTALFATRNLLCGKHFDAASHVETSASPSTKRLGNDAPTLQRAH